MPSGISFIFDQTDVQAYLQSPSGTPYLLTINEEGTIQTSVDGTGTTTSLPYVALTGSTMTGNLVVPTLSGTSIFQGGIQVVNSGLGLGNVTVTKSNGTLTISGTQYTLPSNVVQSVENSGLGVSLYGTQIGSAVYLNSITGLGTITLAGPTNGLISISGASYSLPSTVVQSASSSGVGQAIYNSQVGSNLIFNTITGIGSNVVTYSNGLITISGTDTGEINTASSSGTGKAIFNSKVGSDLIFNTITGIGTNNVTYANGLLTISGTEYTLPSTVVQSASTSGLGYSIYNSQVGSNLIFNSITGIGSISTSLSNGIITLSGNTNTLSAVSSSGAGVSLYNGQVSTTAFLNSITGIGSVVITGPTNGLVTISGSSAGASSSGVNLGTGYAIFDSLSGSNLQFNSISGIGSLVNAFSIVGNTIIISGSTSAGTGDVVGPSSSLTNSIPTFADATGKLLKDDNGVTITPSGTLNATTVSATTISATTVSGTTLSISGTVFYPPTLTEIDFGSLPVNSTSFTITDARVTTNSLVEVKSVAVATSGRTADDYYWDNIEFSAGGNAGSITVYANTSPNTTVLGTRKIQYQIY